ncbi:MAG: FG-GAP-like repeat-containing protein [Pirellulaceae bacterium]|nr:FG-GAP-like repeat-containing protein [Pirellulaceae bacterium]
MHQRTSIHCCRQVVMLFLVVAGVCAGCRKPANTKVVTNRTPALAATSFGEPPVVPILEAIPDFSLTATDGETVTAADLRDKVLVVNFMHTRGTAKSTAQSVALERLQMALGQEKPEVRSGVRLLSVTLDPEFDSVDVLGKYAESYSADPKIWRFLSGSHDEIVALAKQGFGVETRPSASSVSGPADFDSRISLVDRSGRVRAHFDPANDKTIERLTWAIHVLIPEIEPPESSLSENYTIHITQPPGGHRPEWLEQRRAEQLAAAEQYAVFHAFKFTDRYDESGIQFHGQIVDEQRWRLQVNHYDHGSGIAIADVDGDQQHDIYFVSQVGDNMLWRNRGDGTFEDITASAGVSVAGRVGVTASFADIDNDGDADLYVTTVRGGNVMLKNDGKGVFTNITKSAGLEYTGHSSAGVFFDYNRDGKLDLFLVNVGKYTTEELAEVRYDATWGVPRGEYKYYVGTTDAFAGHLKPELSETSILYRNDGNNHFVDVTEEVGLTDTSWSGDATPLDANNDGWLDLYVLDMQGHDEYFENVEGKQFVRKSRELFPRTPWGAMGVKVFDFDNDGQLDIYITDMHSDMSDDVGPEREKLKSRMQWPETFLANDPQASVFGNAFYRNLGDGRYEEISDSIGAENYWPWGHSVGDLNADGFDDVFVASSMCFPYRYGPNSVLLNEQGKRFVDSEYVVGVEPRQNHRTAKPWFVLDASGADRESRLSEGRTGQALVWSALGTRSSVIFDLDDDGDLDIVTNEFNDRPMVLISDLTERKQDVHFVKVALTGTASNRDGLGATVRVQTSQGTYLKTHDGKSGYLSQSSYPLYFGLGDAGEVTKIEVTWPSGTVQVVDGPVAVNSVVAITEEVATPVTAGE